MDRIEENTGSFDILKHLGGKEQSPSGAKPKKETPTKPPEPKYSFPWGDEWLSIHNDYLFHEI